MIDSTMNLDKATFLQTFRQLLNDAQILDITYPIQGCYILLPYGHILKNLIFKTFSDAFSSNLHAQEITIPLRIPQNYLLVHSKSKDIRELPEYSEQIPIRPIESTNDANYPFFRGALDLGLYHLLKHSISSYKDLPQTWITRGFTFRGDSGIPLARDPEVEFLEGILVIPPDMNILQKYLSELVQLMTETFISFGIPVIPLWKPAFAERFPENKSIKLFTYIPTTNSFLSVGIIHFFNDNPTKYFEIQVQDQQQKHIYPWIINFGITQRALFALLVHHMDKLGFVFPPVFIPQPVCLILRSKSNALEEVEQKARQLLDALGLVKKVFVYSPQKPIKQNLSLSEMQGIPLRIEIGPQEIATSTTILFNRYTLEKIRVIFKDLKNVIDTTLNTIQSTYEKNFFQKKIHLSNYVKNGLAEQKLLCTNCQKQEEELSRVLGREYSYNESVGDLVCQQCGLKKAVPVLIGNYW